MAIKTVSKWVGLLVITFSSCVWAGPSVYTSRLDDPRAEYLEKPAYDYHGDGVGDDTAVLQAVIDKAAEQWKGIVFIPSGTYRISKQINVWPGIRLIGYGKTRPVFVLGENTPGYQEGDRKYMLFYAGGRNRDGEQPRDGNPGTFYSALTNIDFRIEEGNPAAMAVRFHVAQHCFVSHADFHLGSARAGLHDIGNEVEDLHFYGGQYGILSGRSAPSWPIVAMDCTFEGQSKAALRLNNAGLVLVRPQIKNVPTAVDLEEFQFDEFYICDGHLENVSGPAVLISSEYNPCNQISMERVVCKDVEKLALFRLSGRTVNGKGQIYRVNEFVHGLHQGVNGNQRNVMTSIDIEAIKAFPAPVKTDIARLPDCSEWVNVHTLGLVGDAKTDNAEKLNEAIQTHRVLYFPSGLYNVSNTIHLKKDTVLIGLHPSATVINVADGTKAFQGDGDGIAVLDVPKGGTTILNGFGVYTGAVNPRAIGIVWRASETSLINDVRLHGGHGTYLNTGGREWRRSRDTWNSQPASLWVKDGGGGVFKDIWTPNVFAKSGMLITDTDTRGRLYVMSSEHHVKNEVILRNVSNWAFYGLQFEEEREEGPEALPLLLENCEDVLFANTFLYRVISCFVPYPHAVKVSNSDNIRFRNFHLYSNSRVAFDSSVHFADIDKDIRDLEYAQLDIRRGIKPIPAMTGEKVIADNADVVKIADGFKNIAGAAVDSKGQFYFTDAREKNIYRWLGDEKIATVVREIEEQPLVLTFDKSDNLLVVGYEGNGTVYSFDPETSDSELVKIEAEQLKPRENVTVANPVNRWNWDNEARAIRGETNGKSHQFVSPDGALVILATNGFITGSRSWGVKMAPLARAFKLAKAEPGELIYMSNEAGVKTYSFVVSDDGQLVDGRLFAEAGGESVAVDKEGYVYLAAGEIYVYHPNGTLVDVIHVPQRPISIEFGDADGRTLYITARDSLYSVKTKKIK